MADHIPLSRPSFPAGAGPAAAVSAPEARAKPMDKKGKKEEPRDAVREVVETVVFVIVLVLLLKTFVAEAFVIPTGSMAETLWGYQRVVECPDCHYRFPVNCANEVDPQQGPPVPVTACTCPNCRHHINWQNDMAARPDWSSGDRVLVAKYPFDRDYLGRPNRFDTSVFKYPEEPEKKYSATNYIKRIDGLSGETIAIFNGDLYVAVIDYPDDAAHPRPEKATDLWKPEYMYENDDRALQLFKEGKFKIIRKSPAKMLAMRRIVYDNDFQAASLARPEFQRWADDARVWKPDNPSAAKVFTADGAAPGESWLRYRHLLVPDSRRGGPDGPANAQGLRPEPITNFMGYNTGEPSMSLRRDERWVPDLMLDVVADVRSGQGELVLELSKGVERFQARFHPDNGTCELVRINDDAKTEQRLGEPAATKVKAGGRYRLRFANFDDRLTVWVDEALPFKDGVEYTPLPNPHFGVEEPHPTGNDRDRPASVGVRGGASVSVSHLQVWRDTYYTQHLSRQQFNDSGPVLTTRYVQPGHYLALGDNSSESSDSRYWGLVPERLLLGRALLVYWPLNRVGMIK
jgi:signal peptidase I